MSANNELYLIKVPPLLEWLKKLISLAALIVSHVSDTPFLTLLFPVPGIPVPVCLCRYLPLSWCYSGLFSLQR